MAGAFAVASGLAYLVYLLPIEGRDAAITAWNLLIIPTALYVGGRVAWRGPILAAGSMAAGVTASLLWAFAYDSPILEPWWIGLAAGWWLGLGWLLRAEHRALGIFTLLLGVAAAIDFVVTALNAPMPIYALGAFKLPLTTAWSFWVGLSLVRGPAWGTRHRSDAGLTRWSGATALIGGLLWALFAAGWMFSHGSTQDPSGARLLGLGALEFTRLLTVPAALWAVSLLSSPVRTHRDGGRAARTGVAIALVGVLMVGLGAMLQTSIVDPERDFGHPAVQGGWLIYVTGLVPVLSGGMLMVGLASSPMAPSVHRSALLIGLLTPLPVIAYVLSGVSAGGLGWNVGLATMHAAPGVAWLALGYLLLSDRHRERSSESM